MNLKKTYLLLLTVFASYSQDIIKLKSPEAHEIERYGNVPVNLAVGSIDMSIPLYNHNDMYDISIIYNSSGFIPAKKSNYVGLNWFLNYGGVITREINTVDDDLHSDTSINPKGIRTKESRDNELWYNIFKDPGKGYVDNRHDDFASDKYNFNMFNIQGYFYLEEGGVPVITSTDENLKIDLSGYANQYNFLCVPDPSTIVITDGNGTKYTFGGSAENLEYSHNLRAFRDNDGIRGDTDGAQRYSINSWYLSKVEFTNNDVIDIVYKKLFDHEICNQFGFLPDLNGNNGNFTSTSRLIYEANLYYNEKRSYILREVTSVFSAKNLSSERISPSLNINLVKKALPEKIIINNSTEILFNYETQKTWYRSENLNIKTDLSYDYLMLNEINIKRSDTLFKKINFAYERIKDYTFLNSIVTNDQKYTLEYYNKLDLPLSYTLGIDHWGYWNGKDNNQSLIPEYTYDLNNYEYKIIGENRNPNPDLSSVSLLKKITYPTGGTSEFEYEAHDYSKKIDYPYETDFKRSIIEDNGILGGARIKKITTKSNEDLTPNVKEFKYINENGKSSGINTDYIRYFFYYYGASDGLSSAVVTESNRNVTNSAMSSSPIEYSKVLEYENSKLVAENNFLTYEDIPDYIDYESSFAASIYAPGGTYQPKEVLDNLALRYEDMSFKRRRLSNKKIFTDKSVIEETFYKYENGIKQQTFPDMYFSITSKNLYVPQEQNYTADKVMLYLYTNSPHIYPRIIEEKKISYFNDHSLIQIKKNKYDPALGLLLKEEYIDPLNIKTKITNYTISDLIYNSMTDSYMYSDDKHLSIFNNHIYNTILSTTQKVNDITVSETFNVYDESGKGNIRAIYTKKGGDNSELVSDDNLQSSYQYGVGNKVNQIKTKDGQITSIVYGYNNEYPIAKLEGVEYNQIDTKLINQLQSATNSNQPNENQIITLLNQLRYNHANAFVTTYLHKPLVGITKIIDPNGKITTYNYDENNRLKNIIDHQGNVISENQYNYKN